MGSRWFVSSFTTVLFLSSLTVASPSAYPSCDDPGRREREFPVESEADPTPLGWDEGDFEAYAALHARFGEAKTAARGRKGVIAGTTEALAVRAGFEALKRGGSAMDAVLTAALAQVTLTAGSTVSFAGMLTLVYHDAAAGKTHALDAGFDTVLEETDPLTIPKTGFSDLDETGEDISPGRTVLVPGFMAGIQAAHDRFGTLPFARLFDPAIHFAEEGFVFTPKLERFLKYRKTVLSRRPGTRAVFLRPDGEFIKAGVRFRQPVLAATLRAVAENGAEYMYRGAWAEHFVRVVREEGGRITGDELSRYAAIWSDPLEVPYRGYRVMVHPGATNFAGMLRLADAAKLADLGHYASDPEAFYWLVRILRRPSVDFTNGGAGWRDPEALRRTLEAMRREGPSKGGRPEEGTPSHSAALVAVDDRGNVAALLHSINTVLWGESGIFVDGVSIPDAAAFQQRVIASVGPGRRIPNQTAPLVALREGRPVLAVSCIGGGIHHETVKVVLNMLDSGMTAQEALDAPSLHYPAYGPEGFSSSERLARGAFPDSLLDEVRRMGLKIDELDPPRTGMGRGYATALRLGGEEGNHDAGAPRFANGAAIGF